MTKYRFYSALAFTNGYGLKSAKIEYSHVWESLLLYISAIKDQPTPMDVRKLDKSAHERLCSSHLSVVPSNCWHIGMHSLIVHDIGVLRAFNPIYIMLSLLQKYLEDL